MKFCWLLLFVLYILPLLVLAGNPQNSALPIKQYATLRVTGTPPVIDGLINDVAWEKVPWEGGFIQHEPYNDTLPSEETAFKIVYDDRNLYVAIRAWDREPEKIVTRMSRRDEYEGDMVGFQLDSYNDQLTDFTFIVSVAGVQIDFFGSEDGTNEDFSWDAVWHSKTRIDEQGWTAEFSIPLTQIRFGKEEEQTWGLEVIRYLFRKDELSLWQHIPKDASGWTHNFGKLTGLTGIKTRKQVEIMPYAAGKYELSQKVEGDPYKTGEKKSLNGGVDAKIGLTNDLTLDLTVNPDFGQVEADPSVLNLSGFETYYDEKRPFFIEGRNILSFGVTPGDNSSSSDNLFYTRRIGRRPHVYPNGYQYVDMPENSTILGAFKITGKTRKGLSLGIMESVTGIGKAHVTNHGTETKVEVEPLTNYMVSRVQQDFSNGDRRLGAMFTSTHRDLGTTELKKLHNSAYTGGVDFNTSWKNRVYYINTKLLFSQVYGSKEAIRLTQESPVHYFQQPDASYKGYDTTRTSLSGHGGLIEFGKGGDGRWQFDTWLNWRSPGLELNDVGFLRVANDIFQVLWIQYRWLEPFSIFRKMNINFNQWSGWDFGGHSTYKGSNVNFNGQFMNFMGFGGGINRDWEGLSNNLLRGGPALKFPGYWNGWASYNTDERKKLMVKLSASFQKGDFHYDNEQYAEIIMVYKPADAVNIQAGPEIEYRQNRMQYITQKQFESEPRYLLGTIDQKVFSLSLRVNYSLSPTFTIQYYGQPFIASGDYSDFKMVTDPRNDNFDKRFHIFNQEEIGFNESQTGYVIDENRDGVFDYEFKNPNFTNFDFKSNLVIRWEYLPGSTFYLVWSQFRTGNNANGIFHFGDHLNSLIDAYPQDIFMVKFSYRMMR